MIKETELGGWIWIHRGDEKDLLVTRSFSGITGKYLFFSNNKVELIRLAKELLKSYKLDLAKVPIDGRKIGNEWVLCVYDKEPSLKNEMSKYASANLFYRGWKSNEDTLKGKYSKKFKREVLETLKKIEENTRK